MQLPVIFALFLTCAVVQPCAAEAVNPESPDETSADDRTVIESFIRHAVDATDGLSAELLASKLIKGGPEAFCWIEFRNLEGLNIAYALTADTAHLDRFRDAFQLFRGIMSRGPDGFLGWYGVTLPDRQPADNPELEIDEIQTNFRAIGVLSRWVELARGDEAYAAANTGTIASYLELAESHLFPKWDKRGHFVTIPGRGGVYRWLDYPIREGTSLPFEKLSIITEALLRLHRVTGNDIYMKRALQLGAWFKSNLILRDGHYEWMSWVPGGTWDINPEKEDAWRIGWMAPDPIGDWYVAALSIALNLYEHGLLFDQTDLARFVKTQKEMCWNGNMDAPEYRTVDGSTSKWTKGRFLSFQIAHHDPALSRLAFNGPHEAEILENAPNDWRGGIMAQSYITEKFLNRTLIAENPQPYADFGITFLKDPDNRIFTALLAKKVEENGTEPPRKPSHIFTKVRSKRGQWK